MMIENASALPPRERQRIMSSIKIEHDRYKDAIEGLRQFHFPVEGGDPGVGALSLLFGDARTGKTYSVRQYVKAFPPSIGDDGVELPVLYVDVPIEGGNRGLLEALADGLQVRHSQRMNSPSLVNLVLRGLVERRVQLLILDETQEIFRDSNKRLLSFSRGLIRKILNLRALNVVCVGLVETYPLLSVDPQLTGRGGLQYRHLEPYAWGTREEQGSFRLLCHQIDQALPFDALSGLARESTAQRLYWVTQGNIGRLMDFIVAAGCLAINDGASCVESGHFSRAYDYRKPLGSQFNPFVHDLSHGPATPAQITNSSASVSQMFSKKGGGLGRAA